MPKTPLASRPHDHSHCVHSALSEADALCARQGLRLTALRKRVLRDGTLAGIDPIVDLYNAISIQYALPIGGENFDAYVGAPHLTIADGSELFDTMKDGSVAHESPEKGEVIWRDELGVTCRRWNWRRSRTVTKVNEGVVNTPAGGVAEIKAPGLEWGSHELVIEGHNPYSQTQTLILRADDAGLLPYNASSKFNSDWTFLQHLHDMGYAAADQWLTAHKADVGVRSSLDVEGVFLGTGAA